jgi:hypothetical protein
MGMHNDMAAGAEWVADTVDKGRFPVSLVQGAARDAAECCGGDADYIYEGMLRELKRRGYEHRGEFFVKKEGK